MNQEFRIEHKTVQTYPWTRSDVLAFEENNGWKLVKQEKITKNKVALVFQKIIPNPMIPKLETEARKYLAENITESE